MSGERELWMSPEAEMELAMRLLVALCCRGDRDDVVVEALKGAEKFRVEWNKRELNAKAQNGVESA